MPKALTPLEPTEKELLTPGIHVARAPRWKMAVMTWCGVCIAANPVNLTFRPVTSHWPWFLNYITVNAGIVTALIWVVMPILNRVFSAWLLPVATK